MTAKKGQPALLDRARPLPEHTQSGEGSEGSPAPPASERGGRVPGVTSAVRLQEALLCSPAAFPNPPRSPGLPHLRPRDPRGLSVSIQLRPLSSPVPSGQPRLKTPRVLLVAFKAATDTPLSRSSRTPPTSQHGRTHAPLLRRVHAPATAPGTRALTGLQEDLSPPPSAPPSSGGLANP